MKCLKLAAVALLLLSGVGCVFEARHDGEGRSPQGPITDPLKGTWLQIEESNSAEVRMADEDGFLSRVLPAFPDGSPKEAVIIEIDGERVVQTVYSGSYLSEALSNRAQEEVEIGNCRSEVFRRDPENESLKRVEIYMISKPGCANIIDQASLRDRNGVVQFEQAEGFSIEQNGEQLILKRYDSQTRNSIEKTFIRVDQAYLEKLKEFVVTEKRLQDGRDRYFTSDSYSVPYDLNGENCSTGEHPFGGPWRGFPADRISECATLLSVAENNGCASTLRNFVAADYCSAEAFGGSLREATLQLDFQTAKVNELKSELEFTRGFDSEPDEFARLESELEKAREQQLDIEAQKQKLEQYITENL